MDNREDTVLPSGKDESAEERAAWLDQLPVDKRAQLATLLKQFRENGLRADAAAAAAAVAGAERASRRKALEQEERSLESAGLPRLFDQCAQGYLIDDQSPVRINANAHPSSIAAIALSRALRCEAFAELLEKSVEDDATYQLLTMTQEVVSVLRVLVEHPLIMSPAAAAGTEPQP